MSKLFSAFCLTIISGVFAFAQSEVKKTTFYVGYSNIQVESGTSSPVGTTVNSPFGNSFDRFFNERPGLDGIEAAAVFNVNRFIGVKGDFSANYRTRDFGNAALTAAPNRSTSDFRVKSSLYNFLGGVEIKDNSSGARVKPFGHVLAGVGYGRTRVKRLACTNAFDVNTCSNTITRNSDTGFAGAVGGGLDIKLTNRIGVRAIQIDYNPVHLNGRTLDNVRFGGGITF